MKKMNSRTVVYIELEFVIKSTATVKLAISALREGRKIKGISLD